MHVQLDIGFDQLVKMLKALSPDQLLKIKQEIESSSKKKTSRSKFEKLLLNGPVASKKDLKNIEDNIKAVNLWRTI